MEFKMLENEDMFVRIDLPGVPRDGVRVFLDQSKKAVCIFAEAPKEHKYDFSNRSYGTTTGLICKCCAISGFTSLMCDGVLRLLLTKTKITPQRSSCICNYLFIFIYSVLFGNTNLWICIFSTAFLGGPGFREGIIFDLTFSPNFLFWYFVSEAISKSWFFLWVKK